MTKRDGQRGQARQDRAAEMEAERLRKEAAERDKRERDAETERRRQARMREGRLRIWVMSNDLQGGSTMGRQRKQDQDEVLTRKVAEELTRVMASGTAFWDEFIVSEPMHRDNGAVYVHVESAAGAHAYIIVSPKWIEKQRLEGGS